MTKKTERVDHYNELLAAAKKLAAKDEKIVDVTLPYIPGESKMQFVGLNGRNIMVEKGVKTPLPESFAEIIEHSMESDAEALEYIESAENI